MVADRRVLDENVPFGWHWADPECTDEGWCGPYDTRAEAVASATAVDVAEPLLIEVGNVSPLRTELARYEGDNATQTRELDEQDGEIECLREDRDRIDWLAEPKNEFTSPVIDPKDGTWWIYHNLEEFTVNRPTLREAIDAAGSVSIED